MVFIVKNLGTYQDIFPFFAAKIRVTLGLALLSAVRFILVLLAAFLQNRKAK